MMLRCTSEVPASMVLPGGQVSRGPRLVIGRVWIGPEQLSIGAENFLGDLLQALIQLAPEKFLDGTFRPRDASSSHAAESPHLIEPHDFDFGVTLREFLADDQIFGRRFAVALEFLG